MHKAEERMGRTKRGVMLASVATSFRSLGADLDIVEIPTPDTKLKTSKIKTKIVLLRIISTYDPQTEERVWRTKQVTLLVGVATFFPLAQG